eukprot:189962-Chlamydomonas_euryale.AAC.1
MVRLCAGQAIRMVRLCGGKAIHMVRLCDGKAICMVRLYQGEKHTTARSARGTLTGPQAALVPLCTHARKAAAKSVEGWLHTIAHGTWWDGITKIRRPGHWGNNPAGP